MNDQSVYIYALINPLDNDVFYIGATVNPRSRLSLHRCSGGSTNKTERVLAMLYEIDIEPEMVILDTATLQDAGYWEVFYTDLYRSFGFDVKKCILPYSNFDRKLARKNRKTRPHKYANTISRKIDGKDIHFYRKAVFNALKFYQHT
mgnify:CR=1 FL=1|jgi:hypothetical protein